MVDRKILLTHGYRHVKVPDYRMPARRQDPEIGPYTMPGTVPEQKYMTISGAQATSLMGTVVFADIELYIDGVARMYFQSILAAVSMGKNIVRTTVNNRVGTVKEYINDGDFSVQLQGLLVGEGNNYPLDDVNTLYALLREPQNIKVVSPFLEIFGIYELSVESYNIPQQKGFQNVQPFDIQAYSDQPIELTEDV